MTATIHLDRPGLSLLVPASLLAILAAVVAAQLGVALPHAAAAYARNFAPSRHAAGIAAPQASIAVRVIVGETQEEAERLAMPVRAVFKLRRSPERIMVRHLPELGEAIAVMGGMVPAETADWPAYVVGTPERVKATLSRMADRTGIEEFMIQDFLDDPRLRLRNYELLARAFELGA